MNTMLGNIAAKEAYREEVRADDPKLEAKAKAAGVSRLKVPADPFQGEVDDAMLAARVSSVLRWRSIPGRQITHIDIPTDTPLTTALTTITARNGVWEHHSDAPPAWVECDSQALGLVLSEHYGCPIGRPDDWDDEEVTA